MHYLLDPQILSTLLTLLCAGVVWALRMLWRISANTRDTKTKVDTLWNWWILHVSKVQLPKDDAGEKGVGFTGGSG